MSFEMNWLFNSRALLLRILVNSVPALLLFGGIELSVRAAFWFRNAVAEATPIVYVFGRDAGPHPPWRRSIIERDRLLSWRSHPNRKENWIHIFSPAQSAAAQRQLIQQFCPRIPDEVRVKPRDLVSLNAEGFRGENFGEAKPEGIYRIISLGDSWTFGTSVGQYQTYPARLEAELNRLDLRKRYEVINLSVPGYSSYHGTLLMKRAVELNPDLIIIGYAMNEPEMAGYKSESTMVQLWRFFVYFANEGLQSVNLARYWARLLSYREDSPVVGLTKDALWHEKVATAVEQPAWLNESLREYKARILLMSNAARARGIRVILLYPEFWLDGPYLRVLKDISHEFNLPLVDWSGLLARASQIQVADRETRFGIARSSANAVRVDNRLIDVVFRVAQGTAQVSQTMYIAGSHPSLNSFEPNTLRMYDDGTHGDEVAGDKIWTLRVRLPSNSKILYTYTNSGEAGVWNGLDIPLVREVDPGRFLNGILPLDEFGIADMHGDPWHTNAKGNSIVAKELASIILNAGPYTVTDKAWR